MCNEYLSVKIIAYKETIFLLGEEIRIIMRENSIKIHDKKGWGALKAIVYQDPVTPEMELVARLSCAAAKIRETPGVFNCV